jgi:hypothetical protein
MKMRMNLKSISTLYTLKIARTHISARNSTQKVVERDICGLRHALILVRMKDDAPVDSDSLEQHWQLDRASHLAERGPQTTPIAPIVSWL